MSDDKGHVRMSVWASSMIATAICAVVNTIFQIAFVEQTSVVGLIFFIIFSSALFFVIFAGFLRWWTSRKAGG